VYVIRKSLMTLSNSNLPGSWQTLTSVDTDTAFIGVTVHGETLSGKWACLTGCRGQFAVEGGTTGLLLVQATDCSAAHRPKTSGVSRYKLVNCVLSVTLEGMFSGWIVAYRVA
jgi:hypothetical protein